MSLSFTTAASAIDNSQTIITLTSSSAITSPNFQTGSGIQNIYIDNELMRSLGPGTGTGTVVVLRGQGGTQANAHGALAPVIIGLPTDFTSFTPAQGVVVEQQNRFQGVSAPVAAAATITPTGPVFHITGTTATSKISLPSNFVEGKITVIADAAWSWTSATTPQAIAQSGAFVTASLATTVDFTYDAVTQLWYPSTID